MEQDQGGTLWGESLLPEDFTAEALQALDDGGGLDALFGNGDGDAAAPETPEAPGGDLEALLGAGAPEGNGTPPEAENPAEGESGAAEGKSEPEPEKPGRRLKLTVGREDREIDLDAMSDDDLRALLQKGMAYDELQERQNRATFRQVYQAQLDAGMTDAAARLIAKDAAGGAAYPLEGEEASAAAAQPDAARQRTPVPGPAPARDLRGEVEQLRALWPEVKEMPEAVAQAVRRGVPLTTAYQAYQARETAKQMAALRQENAVLRQNQRNAAAAPVKGVSGGAPGAPKQKSAFEAGFDAGLKW